MSLKGGIVVRKRLFSLTVIALLISANAAMALDLGSLLSPDLLSGLLKSETKQEAIEAYLPENSLISRAEDTVYGVLRLDDTGAFLRWLFSEENVDVFMPLILKSKDSSNIIGAIEVIRAFSRSTPIKSAAIIIGAYNPKKTKQEPFMQFSFTVDDGMLSTLRKVSDGAAEDADFAKLILGNDNPLTAIAQTMIKAEKQSGGIYRLNNEFFVKSEGDMLILCTSRGELDASVDALRNSGSRLFTRNTRKFADKDFAYVHVDYETLDALDTDNSLEDADNVAKYFDKPLNFELGFTSKPEKFILSLSLNLLEAMKKEYAPSESRVAVTGSYLRLAGTKSPLAALGGYMTLSAMKMHDEGSALWKEIVRQVRVRFGISEEEFSAFFTGPLSVTVNDNVTYEGLKIPAIYISQTGMNGAAEKVFARLQKSPHFQKTKDGVLQLDSSISPVPCFIEDDGETLGINFAELENLKSTPTLKPALSDLMNEKGISALWIDFAGIRDWIMDAENGVFAMVLPMAKMLGFGEIVEAANDILTAEFSVPSISLRAEDSETFRFEFANAGINAKNGLLARIVKVYQKFAK